MRATGVFKRPSGYLPTTGPEQQVARDISKAGWVDLYIDLYRQTHGESAPIGEVLADAMRRLATLKANGIR